MLHCMMLMGSLFLSDGQIMVDFGAVSRAERDGNLLTLTAGGREVRLDASGYAPEAEVHEIVAACVAEAQMPEPGSARAAAVPVPAPEIAEVR